MVHPATHALPFASSATVCARVGQRPPKSVENTSDPPSAAILLTNAVLNTGTASGIGKTQPVTGVAWNAPAVTGKLALAVVPAITAAPVRSTAIRVVRS